MADNMQAELDATQVVNVGDLEVRVGEFLENSVAEVNPFFGFEAFPAGLFDFTVNEAALETMETQKGRMAVIRLKMTCQDMHALKDKSIAADEVVGRDYQEFIFINDALRDIGKLRAIIESAGGTWSGSLQENLDGLVSLNGLTAGITNTHNKEKDRTYANMDLRSIKPLVQQVPPQPQRAVGGLKFGG